GSRHPVHVLGTVMNRVETPQHRDLVVSAMGPVLDEIGNQQHQEQLGEERQAADPLLQRSPDEPAEQAMNGEIDDHQRQPNQQMIDDEMREVGLPPLPKNRLLTM